ncbi:MAG: hypothetical protein ACOY0T_20420 [Myxococcota bacterium]
MIALQLPFASLAHAAPSASEQAQRLFDEAKSMMKTGNYAPACPKLRESQSLEPALGTLLNLADCYEHIGLLASAWRTFREAEAVAQRDGQAAAERAAQARAEALKPRVPFLVIASRAAQEPTLSVQRDGQAVPGTAWGTALALDPGEYEIHASAPGHRAWKTSVTLSAGGGTVTVTVPALDAEDTPRSTAEPPTETAPTTVDLSRPRSVEKPSHGPPLASWVLFGTAAAAVGTSVVLGAVAKSQYDDANCPRNVCATQNDLDDRNSALGKATAASVTFVLGAALAGTGVLLWALAPSRQQSGNAPRLEVRTGLSSVMIGGSL